MSKGVIYILTNPSFPEYVKIGYAKDLEKRMNQLNRSETIPFAFRAYAVYEVESNLTDLVLHDLIDKLNPDLRSIENFDGKERKREFYAMSPEDAYSLLECIAKISGTEDRLKKMVPEGHEILDEETAVEVAKEAKRGRFKFSKYDIPIGAFIQFECDEALHVSIEGYESLFVISDSDKKDPGTDTILTLRPVHPWDRMDEDEFVQCIKGIVPNPAVQIEIETDKRSESYSSDYFDDLDLSPLLDYSWNNTKNIRKIDIDLTCEEYGFKGRGCIGLLIKNDMPVEEIEILSKDVEIDGEIYTLSSSVKYKNNCITETSTSISVDEDGEIDTNTSWSERFKSKSSLSIHGIEVPYNLFPNYSNKMSKAVLNIPFPFSFRLDIGVNSDLNLNSARDQIIYDEKWLTFEENLYQVICKRLKEQLSLSDWERLNEIIQKNGKNIFSRVANNIE